MDDLEAYKVEQKEILARGCPSCGAVKITMLIGYSCPITYICECEQCNHKYYEGSKFGGIKVLSEEESVRKRPHWYVNDPKWGEIAREEIAKNEQRK